MWVVKLGGSLAKAPELGRWLEVIARAGAGKAVVVPGGGPWADELRAAQRSEGFDDRRAHALALRAMERYAQALLPLCPESEACASADTIRAALARRRVAVWLAHDMVIADERLPQSWDLSSDSLAAWLAARLGAKRLALVKSVAVEEASLSADELVHRGWVDPLFPDYAARAGCPVCLFGRGDENALAQALVSGTPAGMRVVPAGESLPTGVQRSRPSQA